MTQKTRCESCETEFDLNLSNCPKCFKKNKNQPKEFEKMAMFSTKKQLAIFFTGWLVFKLIASIIQVILLKVHYPTNYDEALGFNMTVNSIVYIMLIIILLLIVGYDLKNIFPSFKKIKPYLIGCAAVFVMFSFNYSYGSLVSIFRPLTNNNNEQGLTTLESAYPLLSIIIFGFIGPICEELTYRVGLFSFIRKSSKPLAYILTMIIFAFIHFDYSGEGATLINELLNLPYYMFAALTFSYIYERYGLSCSISAHIVNNVISLALVALIK